MKRVIIESPYAGDVERNTAYARAAMLDSLRRGEAPFLSHLLYTQVLDDTVPADRRVGIDAGLAWGGVATLTAVYQDLGVSTGMLEGMSYATLAGRPIVYRTLPGWSLR